MKALTICQPYAELIARGDKPIENRTWPTSYRGPLAIHAGKSKAWLSDDDDPAAFAYGAVIAVAELVACLRLQDADTWPEEFRPLAAHEHANGPWCWILEHVQRITPIPCSGARQLWDCEARLLSDWEALNYVD